MRDRLVGLSLGWRWFSRPAGANRALRRRRIAAAACAVFVAIFGATLWQANADRAERGQAQQPRPAGSAGAAFQVRQTDTPYRGDVWTTVFMSRTRDAQPPPGVPEFPKPGSAYVSPAVQRAIAAHPALAARVPGDVVGTIGAPGLQSPDQYFVYAGAEPGRHWRDAGGWGWEVAAVARPSVPSGALLGLVAVLMGVPAVMLARATGRMSAVTRQRSLAACHLLGLPVRMLVTASVTDAALCGLVGGVLGAGATALGVLLLHDTGLLGIAWFPQATLISPAVLVVSVVAFMVLVAWDAARSTRVDMSNPIAGRAGGPRPLRAWTVLPLTVGIVGLVGIVTAGGLLGLHVPPAWAIVYFLVGGAGTTIAALAGLPVVLETVSQRLRSRGAEPAARFVAVRRLSWQRDSAAAAAVGVLVVAISGLVAAGALADLAAISPDRADGDRYAIQGLEGDELDDALRVAAPVRILQVNDEAHTTSVGECPMLARFVELSAPGAGARFESACRPGATYRVGPDGSTGPGQVVIPELGDSALAGSTLRAGAPRGAAVRDLRGQRDLIVYPGARQGDVDTYVRDVLAVAPQAEVSNLTADSYQPMVAPTRRLLIACMSFGLLTAAVLLVLTSLDAYRRSRADGARLVALGASQSFAARVHTLVFGLAVVVALGLGATIGWLSASVYDLAGGLVHHPGRTGVLLGSVACLVTAAAVGGTWLSVRREHRGAMCEELRTE